MMLRGYRVSAREGRCWSVVSEAAIARYRSAIATKLFRKGARCAAFASLSLSAARAPKCSRANAIFSSTLELTTSSPGINGIAIAPRQEVGFRNRRSVRISPKTSYDSGAPLCNSLLQRKSCHVCGTTKQFGGDKQQERTHGNFL